MSERERGGGDGRRLREAGREGRREGGGREKGQI